MSSNRSGVNEAADDAHELVGMRQMRDVSSTSKRVSLRLRQRRCDTVENSPEKRWALVAPRDERRLVERGKSFKVQGECARFVHLIEPRLGLIRFGGRFSYAGYVSVLHHPFTKTIMGVGAVGNRLRFSKSLVGAFLASTGTAASMPYAAARRSKAAGLIWPIVEWRGRWL